MLIAHNFDAKTSNVPSSKSIFSKQHPFKRTNVTTITETAKQLAYKSLTSRVVLECSEIHFSSLQIIQEFPSLFNYNHHATEMR